MGHPPPWPPRALQREPTIFLNYPVKYSASMSQEDAQHTSLCSLPGSEAGVWRSSPCLQGEKSDRVIKPTAVIHKPICNSLKFTEEYAKGTRWRVKSRGRCLLFFFCLLKSKPFKGLNACLPLFRSPVRCTLINLSQLLAWPESKCACFPLGYAPWLVPC